MVSEEWGMMIRGQDMRDLGSRCGRRDVKQVNLCCMISKCMSRFRSRKLLVRELVVDNGSFMFANV